MRAQVFAGASAAAMPFYENPLLGAGFWTSRITAFKVIGSYLGLLVWPARLSWDYGYNQIPLFGWHLTSWEDWKALAALAGCAVAAALAIRFWRSRGPILFGVAFFFAAIAPTSNLLIRIGTIMAERFLYLPSVGLALAAVWVLETLWRRLPAGRRPYRWVAGAGLSVLLLATTVRTYARNGDWRDPQRFWLSGVAAAPNSFKTNLSAAVGISLASREDVTRAIRYADRALAILDPLPDSQNSAIAYQFAGILYRHLGDLLSAKNAAVVAAAGPDPQYWYRKSLAAQLRGERIELLADAKYRTENARLGRPGLTSVPSSLYLELGRTYLRLSDAPHALAAFERGRTLESSPDLLNHLASLYRAAGEPHKAALALMESMAVDPNQPQVASTLVDLYEQIDPRGCAVSHQGGAPSPNPDCPLVHDDICAATRNLIGNYLRRGQESEANNVRGLAEQEMGCSPNSLK
jgi:tetratricopeptide (TPR) repeat protein